MLERIVDVEVDCRHVDVYVTARNGECYIFGRGQTQPKLRTKDSFPAYLVFCLCQVGPDQKLRFVA